MENSISLLDGTDNGQLKVRVFAFLRRLDASRRMNVDNLEESVERVFRDTEATKVVSDWILLRNN